MRAYNISEDNNDQEMDSSKSLHIVNSASQSIREKKQFTKDFLSQLFNKVLLDPQIGMLPCQIQHHGVNKDGLSTANSSSVTD